ncbi:MAG TPA: hypothetical protein PK644_03695, partial [bacterium]|nr:hypothetical protein [bacterium]
DRRGLQETFEEVQRFYHIFGASEKVKLFLGHHPHGYYPENQEAMVSFFCQQAGLPEPGRVRVTVRQPEKLRATTQGQVGLSGSRPISELIRERAEKIASARPVLSDRQLVETLTNLLHLPERNLAPHYRNLRPDKISGRPVFRYAIETERNIRAILYKAAVHPERVIPLDVEEKIYLHLPHTGSAEEMNGVIWHRFLKSLRPLYLLDVRGLGESMPDSDLDFFHPYGVDYMCHGFGLMLGESYLGRRVFDVLRTLDLLGHLGAKEIHLSGRGQGALLALFAATVYPGLKKVTLINGPLDCLSWCQAPVVRWPSANFVRNLLVYLDLPDCFRFLKEKLTIIEPWDVSLKPLTGKRLSLRIRANNIDSIRLQERCGKKQKARKDLVA